MVPCFPLLGLTPSGLFMGLSSTIIYTSELILCSTICVPSATRHNIHLIFKMVDPPFSKSSRRRPWGRGCSLTISSSLKLGRVECKPSRFKSHPFVFVLFRFCFVFHNLVPKAHVPFGQHQDTEGTRLCFSWISLEKLPLPLIILHGREPGCLPFGKKIRKFRFEVKW